MEHRKEPQIFHRDIRSSFLGVGFLLLTAASIASAGEPLQSDLRLDSSSALFSYRNTAHFSVPTLDTVIPDSGVAPTRQGLTGHYVRFSDRISPNTMTAGENMRISRSFRNVMPESMWASEDVYGDLWTSRTLLAFAAVTPFVGIGYRGWSGIMNSALGEESGQLYGTIGLRRDWGLTRRLSVSPEIAFKMPFAGPTKIRTADGDVLRLPLRQYVDATIPLRYEFPSRWIGFAMVTAEHTYGAKGANEMLNSGGIFLGNMSNDSTQQFSITFGLIYPF